MSTLEHSLDLLGFKSFDELSETTLKNAFKLKVLNAHPDKGGAYNEFDALLSAYIQLTETVEHITGCRSMLDTISTSVELKERSTNEIINNVYDDIYNGLTKEEFHTKFEKEHERDIRGYSSWLSNIEEGSSTLINASNKYPKIKQPKFAEENFNKVFEDTIKMGSNIDSSDTLIVHPDQMATISGTTLGVSLIDDNTGTFTSMLNERSEYTDIYSAFTHDNTIIDKIKMENYSMRPHTIEELIAQRNIKSLSGYEAYDAYKKKKFEEELEYNKRIREYFKSNTKLLDNDNGFLHNIVVK